MTTTDTSLAQRIADLRDQYREERAERPQRRHRRMLLGLAVGVLAVWLLAPFALWADGNVADQRREAEAFRTAKVGLATVVEARNVPARSFWAGGIFYGWNDYYPPVRALHLELNGKRGWFDVDPDRSDETPVGATLRVRYQTDNVPGWMKVYSVDLPGEPHAATR